MLQPKVIDPNHLVRGVETLLGRLIGEHIQLTTRPAPDLWRVKADPGQLEQVILNLCVNARDAMPTGGMLLVETDNVHFVTSPEGLEAIIPPGRYVLLTVTDNGVGAADGAEALAVAEAWQEDFDLVITDVIMPEMSGQELSARLRERAPGVRILYVSGYTDDAILQHGQLLPNTGFLQKPFSPAALVQRVGEVLHN